MTGLSTRHCRHAALLSVYHTLSSSPLPISLKQEAIFTPKSSESKETKDEIVKHSEIAASKALAHGNTFLVQPAALVSKTVNSIQSMDNLPVQCCNCPAYFTSQSTFTVDKETAAWSCQFCASPQPLNAMPPSVPTSEIGARSQELDFIPAASFTVGNNQESKVNDVDMVGRLVVFCVDASGSSKDDDFVFFLNCFRFFVFSDFNFFTFFTFFLPFYY